MIIEKFKQKLRAIQKELQSFSLSERYFILMAMTCGFLITLEYSIIRPVSNSLLIAANSSGIFPYAWLSTVPLNFLLIALYNHYLPRLGCFRMFVLLLSFVMGTNFFFALFIKQYAWLPFLFYVWKEIYVLVMLQQLWSLIHSTIKMKQAKYLYGLFFGVGGMGGVVGSIIPGFLAVKVGSEALLFSTLPIYLLLMFFYTSALKYSQKCRGELALPETDAQKPSLPKAVKLITQSPFLKFILLLVIFMQVSSTMVDYQFNYSLEHAIADKDLRTAYFGRIMGLINFVTVILQVLGTFLIVHFLGLKGSHFLVPLTFALNAMGFILFPQFGVVAFSYVTVKAFDFSIFGIIKEMLYVPLRVDEKFCAKSVIDVFAYRSAKAFASLIILLVQCFPACALFAFLNWGNMALLIGWCIAVWEMFRRYDLYSLEKTGGKTVS